MELLNNQELMFFVLLSLGIVLGNLKFKGIQLGLSASIFTAMGFGYWVSLNEIDYAFPPIVQQIGLILFIYTVGVQAGPSFFDALKKDARRMLMSLGVILGSGFLVALFEYYVLEVDLNILGGLFTGAITSTPGLAAVFEETHSEYTSIGYGIAYPFGVIGVILYFLLMPKIFKVKIKDAEKAVEKEINDEIDQVTTANFIVQNKAITENGIKVADLFKYTKANLPRLLRKSGEKELITPNTCLYEGDLVKGVGSEQDLKDLEILIGPKTDITIPRSGEHVVNWYLVTNKHIVNKTFKQLNLGQTFLATATRIKRSGLEFSAKPEMKIKYGDKILISSTKGNATAISNLMGDSIKNFSNTSFLPISLAIVLGILLGQVEIPLGFTTFKFGLTGGVLLVGIITSFLGKTGPVVWHLPVAANTLLRQIGLIFFLIPVGVKAGMTLNKAIDQYGYILFLYGALITIIPLIMGSLFNHFVLKENLLTNMGMLSGGMTSTPGLSVINDKTDSDAPQVTYATIYPFALIAIILISKLLTFI